MDICESCRVYGLEPKECSFVSGKPMEKPNIVLIHCVKNGNRELKLLDPLYVHQENGRYSDEILKIYEKQMNFKEKRLLLYGKNGIMNHNRVRRFSDGC